MKVDVQEPKAWTRYQRRLLYAVSVLASIGLAILAGVLVYAKIDEYIDHRYIDFTRAEIALRLGLIERENGFQVFALQQQIANDRRVPPPTWVIDSFFAQNGRVVLGPWDNLGPVLAMGDVSPTVPASEFVSLLAETSEIAVRASIYNKVHPGFGGFAFSPDRTFAAILPTSNATELWRQIKAKTVSELLSKIAPDLGNLSDPAITQKLQNLSSPTWFPQAIDPLTGTQLIRTVFPVFTDGKPLILVRNLPASLLTEQLPGSRYDEGALIVDSAGKIVLAPTLLAGNHELVDRILHTRPWDNQGTGINRRYLKGVFTASSPLTNEGWSLIYMFTWRTIAKDLGLSLVGYTVITLLVISLIWALALSLDRRILMPNMVRLQRVLESEDLNRTMVEIAPAGFALLRFDNGGVLLQNDTLRTYALAASAEELPLHINLFCLYDRSAGATRSQMDREMPLKLAVGKECNLLVNLVRTRYKGKDVLVCSFSDITTLKDTERQLDEARAFADQARAAADSANQAKSLFLATMSHEIRSPLNAILGNLELLDLSPLSSEQSERLHVVTSSSSALLSIVNDILDFTKIESGQMILETIRFDLADTIRQVGAIFEPVAHKKGLDFHCVVDDALAPHCLGDPTKIRQIAVNLVSNAVKFTNTGEVLLEVYLRDNSDSASPVVISVSDSGIGITPEQQKIIFDTFMQADSSIARRYGGTGLGLALCRRLIELMHGTIRVESQPGVGSTFMATLPLKADTHAQSHTAGDAGPATTELPARALRILVVDDQLANRELISAQLNTLGHDADTADGGASALQHFREDRFDLVMTDINMPGMDGYTLAECLRHRGATVPIIAITAQGIMDEGERSRSAGIDAVLLKPVLLERLDQTLRQLARDASSRIAGATEANEDISRGPLPAGVHAALSSSLQEMFPALHQAIGADDSKTVLNLLHAMRGSFAMIHETEVEKFCGRIEEEVKNGGATVARDATGRLESLAREALARRAANASVNI